MNPKNDTVALTCIAFLSFVALLTGAFLVWKGFQSGETFATIGGSGLSGIVGYIGGKNAGRISNPADAPNSTTTTLSQTSVPAATPPTTAPADKL